MAEMTLLRDNARKEMADELSNIRQAKEELLQSIAEEFKVQVGRVRCLRYQILINFRPRP